MSTTDHDQLIEVAWRVVDDTTFTSGLWTLAEVAALFNQRQNRFNRDTKLMLANVDIPVSSGVSEFDLPQDWIATQRATWRTVANLVTPMHLDDRFAAVMGMPSVGGPTVPTILDDQSSPNGPLKGTLYPPPATDGNVGLLYASTLELLDFDTDPANYDIFDVPDDFVPYVMYGVLADMLSKEGRGQDLVRSKYCEDRYNEGVALAGFLLGGFM